MGAIDLAYRLYERGLLKELAGNPLPSHVGVILDGNRRFAKERGLASPSDGHLAGARRIEPFLGWCQEVGVRYVTLWLLSTDNLSREHGEVAELLEIIEDTVRGLACTDQAAREGRRVTVVGALDLLPAETHRRLKEAEEATAGRDQLHVQVAVGYGGREEITDALRSLLLEAAADGKSLEEVADELRPEHIDRHLYTYGLPDPDLIIRTSGEVRLSGFLLWQSAHSEYYFCDTYWPEFRRVDFLRALRDYSHRTRRFGR
ncbi:isoprenyl transferase [Nitriliruptoraceae bacterium ZYF776]|nr:isoprenyl transferase [Profundirhabdus halotolerans]